MPLLGVIPFKYRRKWYTAKNYIRLNEVVACVDFSLTCVVYKFS